MIKKVRISYRHRGCKKTGKICYPNAIAARSQLLRFAVKRAKGNESRRESAHYYCEDCNRYHLTSWKPLLRSKI